MAAAASQQVVEKVALVARAVIALLLGSLRRLIRPADAPPLSPIRSLAYFRPVIDELRTHPAPESYLEYLRLKLRQAAAALPANVQKIYVF